MARRATRSNLVKPQTFLLENRRGSNSGLRCSLVFWMSLYKDYDGNWFATQDRAIGFYSGGAKTLDNFIDVEKKCNFLAKWGDF